MSIKQQTIKALQIKNINLDDVKIGNSTHSKIIAIKYLSKNLVCQTPYLEIKQGITKTNLPGVHELSVYFKGESKKKTDKFYKFIDNLESHIIKLISDIGNQWFDNRDVNFKTLIREDGIDKNNYYLKLPVRIESISFIDEEDRSISPINLKSKDQLKFILEFSNLWIDNNILGLTVVIYKVKVKQYIEPIKNEYVFSNSDSDSEFESNADKDSVSLAILEKIGNKSEDKKKISRISCKEHKLLINNTEQNSIVKHPLKIKKDNGFIQNNILENDSDKEKCTSKFNLKNSEELEIEINSDYYNNSDFEFN
uniref:Uncharacterized protein n=1 Tax=viral metagenome TaxID=1070528 RepID=A0A6C0LTD7_9ZZZZ